MFYAVHLRRNLGMFAMVAFRLVALTTSLFYVNTFGYSKCSTYNSMLYCHLASILF